VARLALGGGWRSVSLDANIRSTRGGVTSTLVDYTSGQDVWFGYGELSLPLVGPENSIPLVHRFRLTGAARYEDYERFGGTATPKFGALYEPVSGLAIKGTWGKSFKAPTLAQVNKVPEGNLLNASYFVPAAPGGQPVLLLGGVSPDLKPEKATTWTATVTATPAFAEGLRLEVSYFHTRYKDRVVQPATSSSQVFGNDIYERLIVYNPTAEQVNAVIAELPLGLVNQTGQAFDPANVGAIVDNSLQNAASQTLEGVDASADYQLTFARGDQLGFNAAVSYLKSNQKLSEGQPTIQRAGTIFDPPHWRARGSATWQRGNFTLSPSITYIGGTLDDRYQPYVRVGSYTSVDAVAQVRISEAAGFLSGIEVTLSLLNIFNEMPATIRNSSAAAPTYDATNYPVIGRSVSLGLSKAW
jgi:outer membrane receptor protein involved in Fe transport